ncbi:MAG: acyl-CoA reductase [Chitinophagales bacterium]|nr:acyl-CoA reductase [Chitinophagales bacterium]
MKTNLVDNIAKIVKLGELLQNDERIVTAKERAGQKNPFFTPEFVQSAVNAISERMLQKEKLEQWLLAYPAFHSFSTDKTVGIIMAGNIPLVGFHDLLCAYVCGYNINIKLSSKDDILTATIIQLLQEIEGDAGQKIAIVEKLENFDAVIATGSNNSYKYFEYYFRNRPNILRKNRTSVAILTGNETKDELLGLADDIFMYFGLGCRNVSKLYVPQGFDITSLFPYFDKYNWMHEHSKYMNNYDYHRAILLLNQTPHLADDKVMMQENKALSTPLSMLYYQHYENIEALQKELLVLSIDIQCIVCASLTEKALGYNGTVGFGKTQFPELNDYADGINTIEFLLSV